MQCLKILQLLLQRIGRTLGSSQRLSKVTLGHFQVQQDLFQAVDLGLIGIMLCRVNALLSGKLDSKRVHQSDLLLEQQLQLIGRSLRFHSLARVLVALFGDSLNFVFQSLNLHRKISHLCLAGGESHGEARFGLQGRSEVALLIRHSHLPLRQQGLEIVHHSLQRSALQPTLLREGGSSVFGGLRVVQLVAKLVQLLLAGRQRFGQALALGMALVQLAAQGIILSLQVSEFFLQASGHLLGLTQSIRHVCLFVLQVSKHLLQTSNLRLKSRLRGPVLLLLGGHLHLQGSHHGDLFLQQSLHFVNARLGGCNLLITFGAQSLQ
mmetsp:Transcript_47831/g.83756  ORF Transcript_47831/g.83756 Transcript_47831/m.83756 type:complete len:322 (+) Transcript_47831:2155-3120(+)